MPNGSPAQLRNLRPYAKGQTGNHSGRPPKYHDVLRAARLASPDAVRVLRQCIGDPEAPWAARVRAAELILDRAFGKPKEPSELRAETSIPALRIEFVSTSQHTEREAIEGQRVIDALSFDPQGDES